MSIQGARRLAVLLLPLVGVALCGGFLARLATHRLTLRPVADGERQLRFRVRGHGINSIESLVFWSCSDGEPLWAFTIHPHPDEPRDLPTVTYGELPQVPDPHLRRVKQVFPPAGGPRPIAAGERFMVDVSYQYDTPFPPAACQGYKAFQFEVQPDGSAKPLGEFDNVERPGPVRALKMSGPDS
jgi:hypothetical protein